jgi:hypothetical protein
MKKFLSTSVGLTWGELIFILVGLLVIAQIIDALFPSIYALAGIPELIYELILVAIVVPLLWKIAKGSKHK